MLKVALRFAIGQRVIGWVAHARGEGVAHQQHVIGRLQFVGQVAGMGQRKSQEPNQAQRDLLDVHHLNTW